MFEVPISRLPTSFCDAPGDALRDAKGSTERGAPLSQYSAAPLRVVERIEGLHDCPWHLFANLRGVVGDLGTDSRGGAGFRVDRGHQDLLAKEGLVHRSKRQAYASIA